MFLVSFPPDRRSCFVKYLKRYEKVTERFRNISNCSSNRLFLSYIKPHRPASSLTIVARWVKSVLIFSLTNTESLSAQSTGTAVLPVASRAGVAVEDIMKASDWTNESTFKTFYHKPVFTAKFVGGGGGGCAFKHHLPKMMTTTNSRDKVRKASVIGATSDIDVFSSSILFPCFLPFQLDLCLGMPQKWTHSVDSCFALGIVMVKTRSTGDNLKLDKGKSLPEG